MNHKTLLIVVLSLALLAGAVAVGIHVLHKEALANVNYIVEIYDETQEILLDGATVWFSFDNQASWVPTIPLGDGQYESVQDDFAGSWWIRLDEPGINANLCDPQGNPIQGSATIAFQHWDVVTVEE